MIREIYLDNNATTAVAPEVFEAMRPYFCQQYGNPSSLHRKGIEAERAVRASRSTLARFFGVQETDVVFTSGGTEGDNLAIKGTARALRRRGTHIITTQVEHPAVLESCRELESEGFRVTYLPVNREGQIQPDDVLAALTDETILVSIMHVNNELGTIFPVEDIAARLKRQRPEIVFHSDGVQAVGKLKLRLDHIDLYTISGHKIHAPKGIGALLIRNNPLRPLFTGGGQERGLRSGTENVPGIVGLAKAVELIQENFDALQAHYQMLRDRFLAGLSEIPGVRVNSPPHSVPTTLNISFPGIPAEVMLHALEAEGVYVSTGAACSSRKGRRSHVLEATHLPPEIVDSSLRFSFSRYTTLEDIEVALQVIQQVVPLFRGAVRRA